MISAVPQVRDTSAAAFAVLTEKELAERRRAEGVRVVEHAGRYWEQTGAPGFFQPVHLLARLAPEEATRPTPFSWGYRAALTPECAGAANGTVPIVRLENLKDYDFNNLPSNRRTKIRKCQRVARLVQLTGPELLLEQGYEVVIDALSRTRHKAPPSREDYAAEVKQYFQGGHWLVLAGVIDGKLGGYVDGYAVDGVAYGGKAYYATWALPTNISTSLVFEFTQVCRRLGTVHTLVNGLHARENAQLSHFKDEMGFVVEHIPIKWHMNVLARSFIRWRRPHAYYRLTGTN
jgi:hypothetical protein